MNGKLVKKNKDVFQKIINEQIEIYNKLIK
jgi:hypothetical protein